MSLLLPTEPHPTADDVPAGPASPVAVTARPETARAEGTAAPFLRVVPAPRRPVLARLVDALPEVAADAADPARRLRAQLRFVAACWRARGPLRRFAGGATNPRLRDALGDSPQTLGVAQWPYVHAGWDAAARFEAIDRHYRCLTGPRAGLHLLRDDRREVARLDDIGPGLALVLDRPRWFQREGELVLSLVDGSERLYSVAFVLGADAAGVTATIGAVQGSSAEDILDRYRDLTKAMHGLRPRDFLLDALRMLCACVGVTALRAVGEAARHHRHPYFGHRPDATFGTSYDEIWAEQEGTLGDDGFWCLPVARGVRPLEEIPSKKRAVYRRRYAFLDDLEGRVAAGVRALPVREVRGEAPATPVPSASGAATWRRMAARAAVLGAIVAVDAAFAAPWMG